MLKATFIAGLGGFVGTVMRFLSVKLGALLCHGAFPLGTFMANILGCFLIGLFYGWATRSGILGKKMNVFLITGLCGGFTTFSLMSDELLNLLESGNELTFWLYLGSSIVLGLIMVAVGITIVPNKKTAKPSLS